MVLKLLWLAKYAILIFTFPRAYKTQTNDYLSGETSEERPIPRKLQHFYDPEPHNVERFFKKGGKIEIILFYGRRRYSKIQIPYLLQNKKPKSAEFNKDFGLVSKVNVILNTNQTNDVKFIKSIVSKDPEYFILHDGFFGLGYCHFYAKFNETKTLYVKIDDDIVYIDPLTIYRMAHMKLTTSYMFISANVINHAAISAHHLNQAVFEYDAVKRAVIHEFNEGHKESAKLVPLPPFLFEGDAWGDHSWKSGPHALLQHLMFFHHLRVKDMGIYDLGEKDLDQNRYYRWSINFFMYNHNDMEKFKANKCGHNDELYISMFLPHDVGRHSGVCGSAIVCHFAYTPQRPFLEQNTSLLQRYHELSQELKHTLDWKDDSVSAKR